MDVLGREGGDGGGGDGGGGDGGDGRDSAVRGRLGWYLARDGSLGARVGVDLSRPHAGCVVGKRGSGKSYTLGVLAEELVAADGVAPVVVDPMVAFAGLSELGVEVVEPEVRADALAPRAWCELLDLDPGSPAGTLVWRAATGESPLDGMRSWIADCDADPAARRAASNHLALVDAWGCFRPNAPGVGSLLDGGSVLDCTALQGAALQAVVAAVGSALYQVAVAGDASVLPWLLVDEAHACATGAAADAIETLYTRGRAPGASVVLATQRPSALPDVAVSQSDLLVAHRLTSGRDVDALAATRPTYVDDGGAAPGEDGGRARRRRRDGGGRYGAGSGATDRARGWECAGLRWWSMTSLRCVAITAFWNSIRSVGY